MRDMLDTTETAEYLTKRGLKISAHTLRRWRQTRRGPVCVPFEGRIRYRVSDLESWLAKTDAAANTGDSDGREDETAVPVAGQMGGVENT